MYASVYTYSLSTTWYTGLQLAGALFRIEPKLVRAQTYPDGVFLVWHEIIRRILDIPLCKYPLGNKNPHIEEQSYIYIKQITVRQKISFDYKYFPTRNICIKSTFSKTDTFGTRH